mgnify:CR=1 FL=1
MAASAGALRRPSADPKRAAGAAAGAAAEEEDEQDVPLPDMVDDKGRIEALRRMRQGVAPADVGAHFELRAPIALLTFAQHKLGTYRGAESQEAFRESVTALAVISLARRVWWILAVRKQKRVKKKQCQPL